LLPVAVDAVGGDKAPGEIVAGAREAADTLNVPIVLVGPPDRVGDTLGLDLIECTEVIEMKDDPGASVRRKKDSSLVRAAEAVRDGKASAMVSAGNTGATMASALLRMGRIKGVNRPAIATPIPVPGSTPTVLLDAGANAEVQADWLVQFAQMGSAFATARYGMANPRVGLLSIGEEDSKGTSLVKETNALLRDTPGITFIGNVEGRDLMSEEVDVVVTDGFTGNVTLKTAEGVLRFIQRKLLGVLTEANVFDQVWPHLEPIVMDLDPDSHGGAMLLGVEGVCIISHGSSSARAIVNAVRVAGEMVDGQLVDRLRSAVVPT